MKPSPLTPLSNPPKVLLKVLVIDADPIFRLGLRAWLAQFSDLEIVGTEPPDESVFEVLTTLLASEPNGSNLSTSKVWTEAEVEAESGGKDDAEGRTGTGSGTRSNSATNPDRVGLGFDLSPRLDVVILGLAPTPFGQNTPEFRVGESIKTTYPHLPVLICGERLSPRELGFIRALGVQGFLEKRSAAPVWHRAIHCLGNAQDYWDVPVALEADESVSPNQHREEGGAIALVTQPRLLRSPVSPVGVLASLQDHVRNHVRILGLGQITTQLAIVDKQLETDDLSQWGRWILAGQQRELRAASTILKTLLSAIAPTPSFVSESTSEVPRPMPLRQDRGNVNAQGFPSPESSGSSATGGIRDVEVMDRKTLQSILFERTQAKLQGTLRNLTPFPLEIDLFRLERKRDLLCLVLHKFEQVLDDLCLAEISPDQLVSKRATILRDLWQLATIEFMGKYYTIKTPDGQGIDVVPVLLQEDTLVQAEILDKIPLVVECLTYLLFQTPIQVDNAVRRAGHPEALKQGEALLQNVIIQVSNAVAQPLLNRFADVEEIKRHFYDRRLVSTREIERFRNELSWKYWLETYFREPTAIFESRYRLLVLEETGIRTTSIYAPRGEALAQLSGVPLAVTLVLELRDTVAPRLQSVVTFLGNGLVYILTRIIGRGIGLIGRGILEGIGSSWRDSRLSRGQHHRR